MPHTIEQYNTIIGIFRAEAKKGKPELTAVDISNHDLNKKNRPGWLSTIFEKSLVLDFLNWHVPAVWACLDEMEKLDLVAARIQPTIVAGNTYNRKFYTLTGNLPSGSTSSSDAPRLAGT